MPLRVKVCTFLIDVTEYQEKKKSGLEEEEIRDIMNTSIKVKKT